MRITVHRNPVVFRPDPTRVITRYFMNGRERALALITRVLEMDDDTATLTLHEVLREFAIRHRNITRIFEKHFNHLRDFFLELHINPDDVSIVKQHLIGSYFTLEYSVESAAFFNPCIMPHPDQNGLSEGEMRIILSFRATGEGHTSSIVFRQGTILANGEFTFSNTGRKVGEAEIIRQHTYQKENFNRIADEIHIQEASSRNVLNDLPEQFTYNELREKVNASMQEVTDPNSRQAIREIMWLADSHYEIIFSYDTDISERIIFPVSPMESRGIEDARFVRFTEEDGSINYYATYTAFDGHIIMPKLIQTSDFYHFRILPLHGHSVQNKNLALFPRKIQGKYMMLSRNDGVNNFIMESHSLSIWNSACILQQPVQPWELVQVGNCGSPIETERGWLLLTHGVGPMRQYNIGAVLLDLEDPTVVLATLDEPILVPNPDEREGYVPNVVYSCGSIVHNGRLIIPYGLSDTASSIATLHLNDLLDRLR